MPKPFVVFALLAGLGQSPAPTAGPADPAARFAGIWVGTQGWAIANPPPGARADQPVTLTLAVTDGKISGTLKPFLGGEEGATLVDATIVGDELHATAMVGTPRPASARRGPANWKDSVAVAFTFRNDGVNLRGRGDVTMGEVPWLAFRYELSKKRTRY
jgi:hypothetical protein